MNPLSRRIAELERRSLPVTLPVFNFISVHTYCDFLVGLSTAQLNNPAPCIWFEVFSKDELQFTSEGSKDYLAFATEHDARLAAHDWIDNHLKVSA